MKNIEYERLSELIKNSIADNKLENDELIDLLSNNKYSSKLIENISSEYVFKDNVEMLNEAFANIKTDRLLMKIKKQKRLVRIRKISVTVTSIAAIFILSLYFFTPHSMTEKQQCTVKSEKMEYNEPTLVIDEQEVIKLSHEKSIMAENRTKNKFDKQSRQRIIVPTGKTHTVMLEDGTEVILNACSELIYNYPFDSMERKVELKGEAYFKVVKDKKAFIVKSDDLSIKVYGTAFNVKSSDNKIETILVEGSIGATIGENKELMIKPNEIMFYNKSDGDYYVKEVDAASLLQWLDGCFKYVEKPLMDVLGDIAKWYDVEFTMSDSVKNKKITFFTTNQISIHEILQLIEEAIDTKFIREGGGKYSVR